MQDRLCGEPFQALDVGFLNQILGFFLIPCQPVREIAELIEERHSQFFERTGLRIRP